jgi:hypothetical protein
MCMRAILGAHTDCYRSKRQPLMPVMYKERAVTVQCFMHDSIMSLGRFVLRFHSRLEVAFSFLQQARDQVLRVSGPQDQAAHSVLLRATLIIASTHDAEFAAHK